MRSYRFSRRAFLGGVGAAFGLEALLGVLEARAQGVTAPPRLLVLHWPCGTIRQRYLPTGAGRDFTFSPILQPFEAAGLREEMIALYGLSQQGFAVNGGGHEAGVVLTMTGVGSPGTRSNGGEADDSCAGGPSFDQIFLRHAAGLQRPGAGYANAIGDARVDSHETSSQCLSYGYAARSVEAARPAGTIIENVPLLPTLEPVGLYAQLFAGFIPGGATDANIERARRALRLRKSVLDSSLRELARIRELAPASERPKLDEHADIVRKVEMRLGETLGGTPNCTVPSAPDPSVYGRRGSQFDYSNPLTESPDQDVLEQAGKLHAAVLRAAFQCDLLRVATLQWASAANKVAFAGMYPGDPATVGRMHHPMTHRITSAAISSGPTPTQNPELAVYEFLASVHTWFNQKTADILTEFKQATDLYGEPLLDRTVVPLVTEVSEATHTRSPMPALIFGGRRLGFQGGQFQNVERPFNDFWLTLSQAFFPDAADPLEPFASEKFAQDPSKVTGVIPGLWARPT